jgi:hypothetical protein
MKRGFPVAAPILLLSVATALAGASGVRLIPNLRPSQTLTYLIRYQSSKTVKTEGSFAAPMAPNSEQMDSHALLQIEILDVQIAGNTISLRAQAKFLPLDSGDSQQKLGAKNLDSEGQPTQTQNKAIAFAISPEGLLEKVHGLDSFSPEQQQAWQEWVARFALPWTFPKDGIKPGGKWKSEQMEKATAPIAGLNWERESTYVENEPCHPAVLSSRGEASALTVPEDTCAVVLTTATLKQNSSTEDATPEEFKRHDLHTEGTAKGHNQIITYISLQTGLLVRATEEANQSMDVLVELADLSNGVHYNVNATSHSEVLLVTDSPLAHP